MTVAFDMGETEQRDQRQILLHSEPGWQVRSSPERNSPGTVPVYSPLSQTLSLPLNLVKGSLDALYFVGAALAFPEITLVIVIVNSCQR